MGGRLGLFQEPDEGEGGPGRFFFFFTEGFHSVAFYHVSISVFT